MSKFSRFLLKKTIHLMPQNIAAAIQLVQQQQHQAMLLAQARKMAEHLSKQPSPIFLELGESAKHGKNGWVTIDMLPGADLYWNLLHPLPFAENRISKVYSSHVFEHFAYQDIVRLLADCVRVLKPAGIFSICVPNARIYLEAYCQQLQHFDAEQYCQYVPAWHSRAKIDVVNYIAYMAGEHRYMFDEENLLLILKQAGLKHVRLRQFDPQLDRLERDFESLYAEGEK